MIRIEKVHLYVEKYDRTRQELLLDFVKEDEFIYFKFRGDYTVNMHLSADEYEPTMLLIHGCAPKKTTLYHGSVLILNMDSLMKMNNERDSNINQYSFDRPATVFLEIQDGEYLAELIDDPDRSSVSMYISKKLFSHLESSWVGNPCALKYLEETFEVSVWDLCCFLQASFFPTVICLDMNLVLLTPPSNRQSAATAFLYPLSPHGDLCCTSDIPGIHAFPSFP